MKSTKSYRILSCDGGGIRGLTSAIVLECLEEKIQKATNNPQARLRDYFDLVAGTSTGSIIACGVAKGISATEIKELYLLRGIEIFPKFWNVLKSLISRLSFGYTQPIYDGIGLKKLLIEKFGEHLAFGDLAIPTIITSYDIYNRQAIIFKNTNSLLGKIPVWEICRSSSAAPVAFPAHLMKDSHLQEYYTQKGYKIPPEGIPLIDGGVVANDPALCAIAERLRWNLTPPDDKQKWIPNPQDTWVDVKDIVVASFGTGQATARKINPKKATGWGAGEWVSPFKGVPLIDILFDGSSDATNYIVEQILWQENCFRFQPILDQASSIPTFNANRPKLKALREKVEKYCSEEVDEQLNALVISLTEPTKPAVNIERLQTS